MSEHEDTDFYYTSFKDIERLATYRAYTPLSTKDVYLLQVFQDVAELEPSESPRYGWLHFFNNHVVTQIRIVGFITIVRISNTVITVSIKDGLGGYVDLIINNARIASKFLNDAEDKIESGSYVEVLARFENQKISTIRIPVVESLTVYNWSLSLQTYFQAQTLVFRKFFLEESATRFIDQKPPNRNLFELDCLDFAPGKAQLRNIKHGWRSKWGADKNWPESQVVQRVTSCGSNP